MALPRNTDLVRIFSQIRLTTKKPTAITISPSDPHKIDVNVLPRLSFEVPMEPSLYIVLRMLESLISRWPLTLKTANYLE